MRALQCTCLLPHGASCLILPGKPLLVQDMLGNKQLQTRAMLMSYLPCCCSLLFVIIVTVAAVIHLLTRPAAQAVLRRLHDTASSSSVYNSSQDKVALLCERISGISMCKVLHGSAAALNKLRLIAGPTSAERDAMCMSKCSTGLSAPALRLPPVLLQPPSGRQDVPCPAEQQAAEGSTAGVSSRGQQQRGQQQLDLVPRHDMHYLCAWCYMGLPQHWASCLLLQGKQLQVQEQCACGSRLG
jgi:hypothetical protein